MKMLCFSQLPQDTSTLKMSTQRNQTYYDIEVMLFYLFISILNIIYKDNYSSVLHKLKPYIALYISFSADFTVF